MSMIRMYASGRLVDLTAPSPNQVDIRDIAHGLAQTNRFNGHTRRAYSVAEHSVMVSWIVRPEHALEALMHDASEAYLGDVCTPLKTMLPEYGMLEAHWMRAILKRFGLLSWMSEEIKRVDALALDVEMALLVKRDSPATAEWPQEQRRMRDLILRNSRAAPAEVCRMFLERFHELMTERCLRLLEIERAMREQGDPAEFAVAGGGR